MLSSLPTEAKVESGVESKQLGEMEQALPESTPAERTRFLDYCEGDTSAAIAKLKNYLEWRKQHCDDSTELDNWTHATKAAIRISSQGSDDRDDNANGIDDTTELPCPLFTDEHSNKKYLHFLPARIDTAIVDKSVWALAIAIYIDRTFDRTSTEKADLVIDVRPGRGWANISAITFLPFMQSLSNLLCELHPLRLDTGTTFPVPYLASYLFSALKPFMSEETANRMKLAHGPSRVDDKAPANLSDHLDEELIKVFEERRLSYFS